MLNREGLIRRAKFQVANPVNRCSSFFSSLRNSNNIIMDIHTNGTRRLAYAINYLPTQFMTRGMFDIFKRLHIRYFKEVYDKNIK